MFFAFALLALQLLQADPPAPPPARGWDDFPVFVWREEYAGKPLPEELVEPFGGVLLMRGEDSGWAREQGLSYLIWNVAGRDALHLDADEAWNARVEEWIRTHDEKLLVRTPCLNDPKTTEELFATLDATIARHGAHPGLGFVLGDEVSLTPNGDPFDLCRCELCETKWKEFAKKNDLPERAPLTDEVRQALIEEDFTNLGAWLARRRFDRDQVVEVLIQLISKRDLYGSCWTLPLHPGVGLLGCTGPTAFGGLALDRLHEHLGLIECYPGGGTRELVDTLPGLWRHGLPFSSGPDPGPCVDLTTVFVEQESAAGLAWCVFDAWMRGDRGLVLWNDAQLEDSSADARARLAGALGTVRTLEWKLPDNERATPLRPGSATDSVAILRDADSTALSFLRDALLDGPTWPRRRASYQREHGTLERKVEGWLRLLEDCGIEPGVLPLSAVCAQCTHQFDVLVLPEILVLGEDDVERLAGFVASGGWLVIDGRLGWTDRAGHPRQDEDLRARLGGTHPERILEAPASIGAYPEARSDFAGSRGARRFVRELPPLRRRQEWLERDGFPRFTGAAGNLAWRTRTVCRTTEELGLVLLPGTVTPEERRAQLRDVSLDGILAPEGFALEWILPHGGGTLRAGDAAVLRIVPSDDALPEPR